LTDFLPPQGRQSGLAECRCNGGAPLYNAPDLPGIVDRLPEPGLDLRIVAEDLRTLRDLVLTPEDPDAPTAKDLGDLADRGPYSTDRRHEHRFPTPQHAYHCKANPPATNIPSPT
jgi:hypothetical protein